MDDKPSSKRKMAEEEPNDDSHLLDRVEAGYDEDEGEDEEDEARKLEAKRAYNRLNAARARKRTKDQLADLCRKIEALSDKNDTMEARNDELMKRVAVLTEENNFLRRFLLDTDVAAATAGANARPAVTHMNPSSVGASIAGGGHNPAHKLGAIGLHPLVPAVPMAARQNYAAPGGPSLWNFQNPQSAMF